MNTAPFGVSPLGLGLAPLLILAFIWPGARVLDACDHERRFNWTARWCLGFLLSFGVFTGAEAPALLLHWSSRTAFIIAFVLWGTELLVAEILFRRRPNRSAEPGDQVPDQEGTVWDNADRRWMLPLALILSAAIAWAFSRHVVPRSVGAAAWGLALLVNLAIAFRSARAKGTARSHTVMPRAAVMGGLLCALVAWDAISSFVWVREDADDTLYSSEALVLQDSSAMGLFSPAHRGEELPPERIYALQSFELWTAIISKLSGLHSLVLLRSLFAPLVVLLSYGLYFHLLKRLLPGGLAIAASIGLAAYFTFGISSQSTPNNYLLSRSAQGKTWLMHIAVPGLTVMALDFLRRPSRRWWVCLLVVVAASLGMAPTAAALIPVHLVAIATAYLLIHRQWDALTKSVWLAACAAPCIAFLLWVASSREQIKGYLANGTPEEINRWRDLVLFQLLSFGRGGGAVELFAVVACPLLLARFSLKRIGVFPLVYVAVLFATALNPAIYRTVADLISIDGWIRLFWLVPIPIVFGCLVALVVELSSESSRNFGPAAGLVAATLALPLMGAMYVWSPNNLFFEPIDRTLIRRAENLFKVPPPLLAMGERLARLPLGPEHRVLCSERDASHLAPLVAKMDFVYTRDFQTLDPLVSLGRVEEAKARRRLAREFLDAEMSSQEAATALENIRPAYVITDPGSRGRQVNRNGINATLSAYGFQRTMILSDYELWERRPGPRTGLE